MLIQVLFLIISMLTEECSSRLAGGQAWLGRDDETMRSYPLDMEEIQTKLKFHYGENVSTLVMLSVKVAL